jgi:hypothetical protein
MAIEQKPYLPTCYRLNAIISERIPMKGLISPVENFFIPIGQAGEEILPVQLIMYDLLLYNIITQSTADWVFLYSYRLRKLIKDFRNLIFL